MLRKLNSSSFLLTFALAGSAVAQATPPAAAPAQPAPPAAPGDPALPTMPDVKDPMLEPMPPAPSALASWKEALRHIHARSTRLHSARATVDQRSGEVRSAQSKAYPTLTSQGTFIHQFLRSDSAPFSLQPTQFAATVDLRQPILNLPVWQTIGTAKDLARSAELSEKDVQRQLLATVADAAVLVITSERVSESTRVSLASALSTADLTRRRAALGAANAVDVLRAEQEVATSRAQVVMADETLRRNRESLGASLGYTGQWGVSPDIRVDELERTAAQICKPVASIDSRADVRAAAQAVEAAKKARTAVDYMYVPLVDVISQLGYYSYTFRSPSFDTFAWSAGAQATWYIFDGGDRYGQARQKEAARVIAQEQLTETQRNAALQVAQADRSISVAQATLAVSTRARDIAKESSRLSKLAFLNGSGTSFDLVDSARRLREAEIDLLNKQFDVFRAVLAAFLAKADCSI